MKYVNSFEVLKLRAHLEWNVLSGLSLEWVPWINLIVIILGLFLVNSKWFCPPALQVSLPAVSTSLAFSTALPYEDVLWIDKELRIFFDHRIFDFSKLKQYFSTSVKSKKSLLLKIDQNVSLQMFLQIFELAKSSGYQNIQIAVESL